MITAPASKTHISSDQAQCSSENQARTPAETTGEPQVPGRPHTPQPFATDIPKQPCKPEGSSGPKRHSHFWGPGSHSVCWHAIPQAHTRLFVSSLARSSLPNAPCALCSCAAPRDVSLTYIPTCAPRRAALVLCKPRHSRSLQQFSAVPADRIARCKTGPVPAHPQDSDESTDLWLSISASPQLQHAHQRGTRDGVVQLKSPDVQLCLNSSRLVCQTRQKLTETGLLDRNLGHSAN